MSKADQLAAAKPALPVLEPAPKPVRWLHTAIAILILLLMTSIILNFYFYSQKALAIRQVNAVKVENNSLQHRLDSTNALLPK